MFTDQVARLTPYLSHNITRVINREDGIFTEQGGNSSLLSVRYINEALQFQSGLVASITLGINSSAIPKPIQGGGGPPISTTTEKSEGITNSMINHIWILFSILLLFLY